MLHYIIPTQKNGYKAKLLNIPALAVMLLSLLLVNLLAAPVSVAAQQQVTVSQTSLLQGHNRERREQGLPPLKLNQALVTSAQRKAQAMLQTNCWSHYCPDEKSPWDFFAEAGYDYQVAGENLAEGFPNVEDVMVAWMNSPTHRDNIIKPEYEEVGFGIVRGDFQGKTDNIIIAVHFGTPRRVFGAQPLIDVSTELPIPDITSPAGGSAFNSKDLEILGTAPGATQVSLYTNDQLLAVVGSNGDTFRYLAADLAEGTYSLSATSQIGIRTSARSAVVNFSVDLTADLIRNEEIVITETTEDEVTINVAHPGLKSLTLRIDNTSYEFTKNTSDIWTLNVPLPVLETATQVRASTIDLAGNEGQSPLNVESLKIQLAQTQISNAQVPSGQGSIFSGQTRSQVNLVFVVVLAFLFGIDFLILARTGFTREQATNSHLHFGILIVAVLITLSGTFSGQILQGVAR